MAEDPELTVLRRLYAEFGTPSLRTMSDAALSRGHEGQNKTGPGAATFSNLLNGKATPTPRSIAAFIDGCLGAGTPRPGLAEEKHTAGYWLEEVARAVNVAAVVPTAADSAAFADQPSRLLVAANEVVDFTGRTTELDRLTVWRDDEAPLSVLWLHGPGGQGKTRLGRRLAADSAAVGWHVEATWATGDVPDDRKRDLLLVVDYADRVPHTDLIALVGRHVETRHAGAQPWPRVRVLMLARSRSPWRAVRSELAGQGAVTDDLTLTALADEPGTRAVMFTEARDAFARVLGVGDTDGIGPPTDLGHPDLGLALSLHLAALVAVDAHARQVTPPKQPADLSAYLLDREEAHWMRLLQRADFRTTPDEMREIVFAACLIGERPRAEAIRVLHFVEGPQKRLSDHAYCYPADNPADVLQPLLPDRLAEDFIALMLPGDPGQRAEPWAVDDLTALLTRPADGSAPLGAKRAITFLAAASAPDRRPHVAAHLEALLRADPGLAMAAGGAALTALTHLDPEVLAGITETFPVRNANLDVGMFDVFEAVVTALLDDADDATAAELFSLLMNRARMAGALERAVELGRRTIELYRSLPAGEVDQLDFALTLNSVAELLAQVGVHEEAMNLAEDALQILTTEDDEEGETNLSAFAALPLVTLGSAAFATGDTGRAVELLERATESAALTDEVLETGGATLAGALAVLGQVLAFREEYTEAVPVLRRAVAAFDTISAEYRTAFEAERSTAMDLLAGCLDEVGDDGEEGARYRSEALQLAKQLSDANPSAHDDRYLVALSFNAARQAETGAFAAAEGFMAQAIGIARSQHERGHPLHQSNLVRCLTILADIRNRPGAWEQAWPLLEEASEIALRPGSGIDRNLADSLLDALDDYDTRLLKAGRQADRVVVCQHMANLIRSAVVRNLGTRERLARALDLLGAVLLATGQPAEAVSPLREAVDVREEADPEDTGSLAKSRGLLGVCLHASGGPAEEAIDLLTSAVEHDPDRESPDVGFLSMLASLQALFSQNGRYADAIALGEGWVDVVAGSAAADPAYAEMHLALRANLAVALCGADQLRAGMAQADRVRTLATDTGMSDLSRAAGMNAYVLSRYAAEEDLEDALAVNAEGIALMTTSVLADTPLVQAGLADARNLRVALLELAGHTDEAARLKAELD